MPRSLRLAAVAVLVAALAVAATWAVLGRLKVADIANDLDVTWLEGLDPKLFRSLNTSHDLEQFHAELTSQR